MASTREILTSYRQAAVLLLLQIIVLLVSEIDIDKFLLAKEKINNLQFMTIRTLDDFVRAKRKENVH